jgi:glycosyltransferase involved in cell wall biosynthesis
MAGFKISFVDPIANPGGGQRFTSCLISGILSINPKINITLVTNKQFNQSNWYKYLRTQPVKIITVNSNNDLLRWLPDNRLWGIPGTWKIRRKIRKIVQTHSQDTLSGVEKATKTSDLIHFPMPDFRNVELIPQQHPFTITLHDLIWKKYEYSDSLNYGVQEWIRRANITVAITKNLQSELNHFFPNQARRIEVIRMAAPTFTLSNELKRDFSLKSENIQPPYLLYPANLWNHKNHATLIHAFGQIRKKFPSLRLVCTGLLTDDAFGIRSRSQNQSIIFNLRELVLTEGILPGREIIGLGVVPDQSLISLYENSSVVCLPSLAEGCSFPLLEAASLAKPIACSNIPAHVEMADFYQIHPFYFDPSDPGEIVEAVYKALDANLVGEDLRKTAEVIKSRHWSSVAKEYLSLWEELLG